MIVVDKYTYMDESHHDHGVAHPARVTPGPRTPSVPRARPGSLSQAAAPPGPPPDPDRCPRPPPHPDRRPTRTTVPDRCPRPPPHPDRRPTRTAVPDRRPPGPPPHPDRCPGRCPRATAGLGPPSVGWTLRGAYQLARRLNCAAKSLCAAAGWIASAHADGEPRPGWPRRWSDRTYEEQVPCPRSVSPQSRAPNSARAPPAGHGGRPGPRRAVWPRYRHPAHHPPRPRGDDGPEDRERAHPAGWPARREPAGAAQGGAAEPDPGLGGACGPDPGPPRGRR